MKAAGESVAEPWVLLGAKRRGALERTLTSCVESWRTRWSAQRDPVHVTVGHGADNLATRRAHPVGGMMLSVAARDSKLACLRADSDAVAALVGVSGSTSDAGSAHATQTLAHEVQAEILRALCAAVVEAARISDATIEEVRGTDADGIDRRRCASAAISIGTGRAKFTLLLAARLVDALAARPMSGGSGMVGRRRAAIVDVPVRVEAMLGEVEVTLTDLVALTAGDVIVLEQSLASAGFLTTSDGTRIAAAHLGKVGAVRAVSVAK
jgi:flagellar motor switch/type III secretory pathway protein FliN